MDGSHSAQMYSQMNRHLGNHAGGYSVEQDSTSSYMENNSGNNKFGYA